MASIQARQQVLSAGGFQAPHPKSGLRVMPVPAQSMSPQLHLRLPRSDLSLPRLGDRPCTCPNSMPQLPPLQNTAGNSPFLRCSPQTLNAQRRTTIRLEPRNGRWVQTQPRHHGDAPYAARSGRASWEKPWLAQKLLQAQPQRIFKPYLSLFALHQGFLPALQHTSPSRACCAPCRVGTRRPPKLIPPSATRSVLRGGPRSPGTMLVGSTATTTYACSRR